MFFKSPTTSLFIFFFVLLILPSAVFGAPVCDLTAAQNQVAQLKGWRIDLPNQPTCYPYTNSIWSPYFSDPHTIWSSTKTDYKEINLTGCAGKLELTLNAKISGTVSSWNYAGLYFGDDYSQLLFRAQSLTGNCSMTSGYPPTPRTVTIDVPSNNNLNGRLRLEYIYESIPPIYRLGAFVEITDAKFIPDKCAKPADCGIDAWTGSPSCQGNSIYQNYTTYACNTATGACSNSTTLKLKETCANGCLNGQCNTACPVTCTVGDKRCKDGNTLQTCVTRIMPRTTTTSSLSSCPSWVDQTCASTDSCKTPSCQTDTATNTSKCALTPINCDDNNPCTVDICVNGNCDSTTSVEDGTKCTLEGGGNGYCVDGFCEDLCDTTESGMGGLGGLGGIARLYKVSYCGDKFINLEEDPEKPEKLILVQCGNCRGEGEYCNNKGRCNCNYSPDCRGSKIGQYCLPALIDGRIENICSECLTEVDCENNPNGRICDIANSNRCVICLNDNDCNNNPIGPNCGPYGTCFKCSNKDSCRSGEICNNQGKCLNCSSGNECLTSYGQERPNCSSKSDISCFRCDAGNFEECANAILPNGRKAQLCNIPSGRCLECRPGHHEDCQSSAYGPICNGAGICTRADSTFISQGNPSSASSFSIYAVRDKNNFTMAGPAYVVTPHITLNKNATVTFNYPNLPEFSDLKNPETYKAQNQDAILGLCKNSVLNAVSKNIGPTGGIINFGNEITINIPSGALNSPTDIAITKYILTDCYEGIVGNPKITVGLYNPSTSTFYLRNSNTAGVADKTFVYGTPNKYLPVAGDWDGDGTTTIGVYDPAISRFYLKNTNAAGTAGQIKFNFGTANKGWLPIVGDWNNDGKDTVGLYDPSTSTFYLKNTNSAGSADVKFFYGIANKGLLPVVGDWDGNGTTTIGVYDPAISRFYLKNSNAAGSAGQIKFNFGTITKGILPITGDWDGDGKTTIGLYDPLTYTFYLKNSNSAGTADMEFAFYGVGAGSKPITGFWTDENVSLPQTAAVRQTDNVKNVSVFDIIKKGVAALVNGTIGLLEKLVLIIKR